MKYVAKQDLSVCDLHIKYSNGASQRLQLSKGQVLPEELLDAGDLKKSLMLGGLRNLIAGGFILALEDDKVAVAQSAIHGVMLPSEVESAKTKIEPVAGAQKKYTAIETISQAEFAEKRDATGMVTKVDMTGKSKSIDVDAMEFKSVVAEKSGGLVVTSAESNQSPSDVVHEENGNKHNLNLNEYKSTADFATVNTREDFEKLNHFDQLLYVKQSANKELLNSIIEKTSKKQIQNNARKRVEELK